MPSVLVTGAAGFVGRALCARLLAGGWGVRAAIRRSEDAARLPPGAIPAVVGPVGAETSWEKALDGAEAVVHLAARAHVMSDDAADPLAAYRAVNVDGTERLARAAAEAGVDRFVYMSSVKVNGESSSAPLTERDSPRPEDPYGVTKWEAEQRLWRVAAGSGLRPCVLRPPLVYGPGVKANFLRLMRTIDRGTPLPFASIRNRRSLIFVGNLADAVRACLSRPASAGRTYLVSDGADVSTPELVAAVARALDRPARLFPCPPALLAAAARWTGRPAAAKRLLGSLTVDSSAIRAELSWAPPSSMTDGLRETAAWFRETRDGTDAA